MNDYHAILGALALIVGVTGYVPYIRDTLKGITKPHPFTYLIWALLAAITFAAQIVHSAGPGAWATAIPVVLGIVVASLSISKGERAITRSDWLCLMGALAAIGIWLVTKDALSAVLIVIGINTLAFIPTFRKAYWKPDEETASSYTIGIVRSFISIPALIAFNPVTLLPLVHHILINAIFVVMLLVRRGYLQK